jgi:hypothetical protein
MLQLKSVHVTDLVFTNGLIETWVQSNSSFVYFVFYAWAYKNMGTYSLILVLCMKRICFYAWAYKNMGTV